MALCSLALPLTLLLYGAGLPDFYGESYYGELPALVTRLKDAQGKKLVLVGGSSVAFGVDVAQLEEEFPGYTVCPMGLYAAVGTSAMLSLAEPYLSAGDIVVLAIEPAGETFSDYFGANAFWKCAESSPWLTTHLTAEQKSALVGAYVPYLQERAEILRSGSYPRAEGVYAKSSFDENCSLTYFRGGNAMAVGFDTAAPVDFAGIAIEDVFARRVNAFIAAAEGRGAEVYLSFAPVNRLALPENWQQGVQAFFTMCTKTFRCRIISDPERYVMDSGWFYDNNFHLNTPGSQVRTHMLACDLLAQKGRYDEPEFQMPPMPSSIYTPPEEETAEAGDFLYEPLGSGWRITGLSEAGKEKTSLTVPESREGKPVVAFTAETFSGANRLEELTLPESIQAIPDGAFRTAPGLKRLVLLHKNAVPALENAPFLGAEGLTVYVPRDSYPMYRDGAGCEENRWQAYLQRIVPY